jgi:hypothetical protein
MKSRVLMNLSSRTSLTNEYPSPESPSMNRTTGRRIRREREVIIMIHFLGLASTEWLASPDNGARRRQSGDCMKPNYSRCVIEPAASVDCKKTPRGKRLRPRFRESDHLSHTYPLTLNRQLLVCLQQREVKFGDFAHPPLQGYRTNL